MESNQCKIILSYQSHIKWAYKVGVFLTVGCFSESEAGSCHRSQTDYSTNKVLTKRTDMHELNPFDFRRMRLAILLGQKV